ncbi:arylformamidase [Evansella sp. LMS18]|uniref:arylformamidase n=1 Tax=Evansella sp. LMS18 TaxID=2924033 RepID=UPI0020D1E3E1|nr:arylformamidase [Evansella sp. LMS18]UTR09777.1 arylformamidase [Evansella sp. LMS18]
MPGENTKKAAGGWIDISIPLKDNTAHWPGDTPFSYEVSATKEQTGSVNIGKITMSTHLGTHIDAPFHFLNDGEKVSGLDLDVYIGQCRVVDASRFTVLSRETLSSLPVEGTERLLIKTSVPNNYEQFPEKIPYITKDGADYLGESGIRLAGLDVPSVDPLDSKELEAHHQLYKNGIYILENIMLDTVPPGDYELIALPLAIEEGDGSPVRAVIRPV